MTTGRALLAVDTALSSCTAAVFDPRSDAVTTIADHVHTGHAERLMPLIEDTLRHAGIGYPDIGAILVTTGPGSFTGLRVGLASARALGLALSVPVQGITTLQGFAVLEAEKAANQLVAVVLETRREDFYAQIFDAKAHALHAAQALTGKDLARLLAEYPGCRVIGDAVRRFTADNSVSDTACAFRPETDTLDMGILARHAAHKAMQNRDFYGSAEAVYLRGADVTMPARPGRSVQII